MNDDRLLTLDDVAQLAQVSRRTVQREILRGRLHSITVGERNVRIRERDALRWAGLLTVPPANLDPRQAT